MLLVWYNDHAVEYPLYRKLVGIRWNGRRPDTIILSEEEMGRLTGDGRKGLNYLEKALAPVTADKGRVIIAVNKLRS